jgi:hypothetical protein
MYAAPGRPLHDPKGDRSFIASLKRHLAEHVPVYEEDAWVNDRASRDVPQRCSGSSRRPLSGRGSDG